VTNKQIIFVLNSSDQIVLIDIADQKDFICVVYCVRPPLSTLMFHLLETPVCSFTQVNIQMVGFVGTGKEW